MTQIKKTCENPLTNRKVSGILTKLFDGDEVQKIENERV